MQKFFKFIFNNWQAKLLSILLAFGLWAFVVNTGFRQEVLPEQIPVTLRDLATDLAVATPLPDVSVEVFAPTASFQRLQPKDLTASINLAGLEAGDHTLEIKVFAEDPNVRIVKISPSLVELTLEEKESENFEVKIETEGQLGQGFVADKAKVEPKDIKVSGASTLLNDIDQVVARIAFNGETTDLEKTVAPVALDADRNQIKGLTYEPEKVDIKVPVLIADDAKTVGVEVDTTSNPAEGFFVGNISVEPSTVTAQGSSKALEDISVLKTETIDLSGATENLERTVKLNLPDNVRAEPEQVKVIIEINAGTSSKEISLPPQITNIGSGLSSTVDPPNLSITLTGPTNQLQDLSASTVNLRVDVSGLGAGDHTVSLTREMLGLSHEVQVNFSVSSIVVHISST